MSPRVCPCVLSCSTALEYAEKSVATKYPRVAQRKAIINAIETENSSMILVQQRFAHALTLSLTSSVEVQHALNIHGALLKQMQRLKTALEGGEDLLARIRMAERARGASQGP